MIDGINLNINTSQTAREEFYTPTQEKSGNDAIMGQLFADSEQTSVSISISEEGMEKYQNQVQENSSDFNEIVRQREELLSGKMMPATDYSFELGNKLADRNILSILGNIEIFG